MDSINTVKVHDGQEVPYIIHDHDLSGERDDWMNVAASVDIETSGLQPKKEKIALVIVHPKTPGSPVHLVRRPTIESSNLRALIANPKPKIFHHAPFDVSFMMHHWDLGVDQVNGIRCTKIAAKVLDPKKKICNRSLKDLASQWADVELPKGKATSNWFAKTLGEKQIIYALEDVLYLPKIWNVIGGKLTPSQRAQVIKSCEYLPAHLIFKEDGVKNPYVY